jgi:hypothetical protein
MKQIQGKRSHVEIISVILRCAQDDTPYFHMANKKTPEQEAAQGLYWL